MLSSSSSPIRVVVVDDDVALSRVLVRGLRSRGADVLGLETPFGATNAVAQHRATVLVLDVAMPGLDGTALWELVRAGVPAPPGVIFYSAADETRLAEIAARFPEAAVARKPVSFDTLWGLVVAAHERVASTPQK